MITASKVENGTFLFALNTSLMLTFISNLSSVFVHCPRPSENMRGNSFFKSAMNFSISSDFSFAARSTFLQNEFTGNSHKSKSAIQSASNKFDVSG